MRGILVDPRHANRVLVAGGDNWNFTGGGIVVSDDGGETWRMTLKGARFYGNGPRRMYGRVLSRDPFNPDRIVAGCVRCARTGFRSNEMEVVGK